MNGCYVHRKWLSAAKHRRKWNVATIQQTEACSALFLLVSLRAGIHACAAQRRLYRDSLWTARVYTLTSFSFPMGTAGRKAQEKVGKAALNVIKQKNVVVKYS
jgi:hypothetical protein